MAKRFTATTIPSANSRRAQRVRELERERNALVDALDNGAEEIEEARARGLDVEGMEDIWIGLLRRYEACCDMLRDEQKAAA